MFTQLKAMMRKPTLYEKGSANLWTDKHISTGMLEAHLHPDWDAATRKHTTVREIVKWISTVAPVEEYRDLLDLGCGPGIYAEEFCKIGYNVAGLDFSPRSINHARNSAHEKNLPIVYYQRDYLSMDFKDEYDLITLIYYDFGVLSTKDRETLLKKIHTALKPKGLLIFDVFTPRQYLGRKEYNNWEYAESGFFSAEPHLHLSSLYRYEEQNTFCNQHIIMTERDTRYINIWEHTFTRDELSQDLRAAGFSVKSFYGNIAGANYCDDGKEMCAVAQKNGF